jgi:hypothetical protein
MADAKVIPISAAAMAVSEEKILEWLQSTDDETDGPDLEGLELIVVHQSQLIRELRRDLDELFDRFNLVNAMRGGGP